jgi:hypothetical protein
VFTPDPSIQYVAATRDQVVAIIEGINQPQVSIPGKAPQSVSAHLCVLRNASGAFSVFVGLHLPRTGEHVIYLSGKRQVSAEEFKAVQDEGLHFLESMGFMLDNLNYRNLAPEQQDATLARIPIFSPPRPPAPDPASAAERAAAAEAGRIARLLASF